ncbi:MAG: peptidoglycan-binding domain-containing protein [Candidatus Omnitrophica bacterium]|nr:peptidoglycan-binding domain-containing protein [Candidatus Omnitrophota bacterium]
MRKFVILALVLVVGLYLFGCAKKDQNPEMAQEPVSMESLTAVNATNAVAPVVNEVKPQVTQAPVSGVEKLEPLPPSGPYKPTTEEIQKALKNASFYTGIVDGKKGPKTKKAVEAFQKANGLEADGKVGPKTWSKLSTYLNAAASPAPEANKNN